MQKITLVALTFAILIAISIVPSLAIASESGENQHIELENTPISSILHEDTSFDGVNFDITLKLVDDAAKNGTNVEIWTQICINSGICYDPVWHCEVIDENRCKKQLIKSEDNSTWIASVLPDETHTYVNYKVKVIYSDDSSKLFSSGKVWSNCWVYGEDSGGNCEKSVPTIGALSVIAMVLIAATIRKD